MRNLAYSLTLLTLILGNPVGAQDNKKTFWTESAEGAPVRVLTPDLFVDISNKYNAAVVNISTVENVKMGKRPPQFGPGGPGAGPGPGPDQDVRPPSGGSPFEDLFRDFFNQYGPREGMKRQSLGSGFIINAEGYIVTNNHVVERADEINVVLTDDTSVKAKVIGRDPKTDIALIKIDLDNKRIPLKTVVLGDSSRMRVGDIVVAIGNPFGLDHTMTQGIISATGRSINLGSYDDFLQTDASINPGNSGGPLMNLKGEVIGINTAINAAGQGIGFAIPINMAKDILNQLRNKGKVTRGWLGVYISKMDLDLAKILGFERPTGAVVSEVQSGSPAAKVQLQKGDVIVSFNGKKVQDYNDLPKMVAATPPNTKVTIEVMRDKARISKTLTLGELPSEEELAAKSDEPGDKSDKLGIDVQELTPDAARSLGLAQDDKGVLVTYVDPDSTAFDKGLRRGDVIQEINRTPVKSRTDYETAVGKLKADSSVLIWAKRRDRTFYLAFTLKK